MEQALSLQQLTEKLSNLEREINLIHKELAELRQQAKMVPQTAVTQSSTTSPKRLDETVLTLSQYQALEELKHRLFKEFNVKAMILYGSVVRGEADEESDLDLLILTAEPLTRPARHKITDIIFEVNLHYNTNFSSLVMDQSCWETGIVSILPIRDEILKEGIPV
jgi:predicted nucleotidyltransferase